MSHERLRLPPSVFTGEAGAWLYEVWKAVNAIPNMSYFSGQDPNSSGVTGTAGQIAVNIGTASNVSRLFLKYGSAQLPDKSSWMTVA